ncbi:hypothetical protein SAMN05661010_01704 [Modicisalibacter muralis]|uniref:Uncharacterized protein n=1 Tax=Modicisalibacter muralis TaxID=119000 RepID=A0A1G9K0W5_9GAMM|nr:hypothetical protein [Halomonas muralis]SDL43429.1 hypothetical protein SAMN05661010_01704 [Halomonas muralis]
MKTSTMMRKLGLALMMALLLGGVAACEDQGAAEEAGENIDEAAEEAGENVEEMGEEIEDAAEDSQN